MLEALVFTTQAFVITDRAKQLGTEQAITLGPEGSIVYGFRLLYLTERPRPNFLG
jgi:hypothetical protein